LRWIVRESGSRGANVHLSDDETVAKMGHPNRGSFKVWATRPTPKQAFSVTGLAAVLKRDPKSVRRDVLKLVQVGVLRTREEINPGHDRVKIVEPVAKRVEMRASF
jgi:hypothetical protein